MTIKANRIHQPDEPLVGSELTNGDLVRAYSTYGSRNSSDDALKFLTAFVTANRPDKIEAVSAIKSPNTTMGWIARMKMRDITLPLAAEIKFTSYLDSLIVPEKVVKIRKEITIKDRLSDHLGDFEQAVDAMDEQFDPYLYLKTNNVPQSYAVRIGCYYTPIAEEYVQAFFGNDPQITEAYSHTSKAQLYAQVKYLLRLIDGCEKFVGNVRKVRKPRLVKRKSTVQLLKHFACLKEYDKLRLVSANPEQIFGATQMFTLNTSNMVMTMFVAKEGGFSVNRTAIINYDPEKTVSKRVGRKLDEVLNIINLGSKKARSTVLDQVSSDFIKSTDRINSQTLIVKIVK